MRLLVVKMVALLSVVLSIQVLTSGDTTREYPELFRFTQDLRKGAEIVYFGDSVLFTRDRSDKDRRTIPQMLQSEVPNGTIATVIHGAYDASVFLGFCHVIARSPTRPSLVIIPVNLRSFSPEWDMRPQYQFTRERYQLRWYGNQIASALRQPLAVLNAFPAATENSFRMAPVYDGYRQVGKVRDFPYDGRDLRGTLPPQTITADNLVLHYMGALRPDHRELRALREACTVLEDAGVQTLVYVTPVDCETGTALLGPRFDRQVRGNVETVRTALPSRHVRWLDLSDALSASAFSWDLIPNEHLKQVGRQYVATQVAAHMR